MATVAELIADLQQFPGHHEVFTGSENCSDKDSLGGARRAQLRHTGKRATSCVVISAGWGPGNGSRVEEIPEEHRFPN